MHYKAAHFIQLLPLINNRSLHIPAVYSSQKSTWAQQICVCTYFSPNVLGSNSCRIMIIWVLHFAHLSSFDSISLYWYICPHHWPVIWFQQRSPGWEVDILEFSGEVLPAGRSGSTGPTFSLPILISLLIFANALLDDLIWLIETMEWTEGLKRLKKGRWRKKQNKDSAHFRSRLISCKVFKSIE